MGSKRNFANTFARHIAKDAMKKMSQGWDEDEDEDYSDEEGIEFGNTNA